MRIKLLNMHWFPIAFIIILSLCIRFYNLHYLMPFVGDQAWFYVSAQDALAHGEIPLVGISASRTWLHQGSVWTYILMLIFRISSHPAAPGYFTAVLGALTTAAIYGVLLRLSNEKTALLGSLMYATSPLIIMSDRMPYHTSLTPILTIGIYYSLWRIIHKGQRFWIVMIGLLALMHNTNLAGFPVLYIVALFYALGRSMKHSWTLTISKKIVLQSILLWTVCMMPFLIYDIDHGFPQTVKFYGWMILEPIRSLISPSVSPVPIMKFLLQTIQRLIFLPSALASLGLFLATLLYALRRIASYKDPLTYTTIWIMGMLAIVIAGRTPSDAYVYTLYPLVTMFLALVLAEKQWAVFIIMCVAIINGVTLIKSNYLMGVSGGYGAPLSDRVQLVKDVILDADGTSYAIKVVGPGEQFASTGMYFEYIAEWLGHPPTDQNPKKMYAIYEKDGQLHMQRVPTPE